MAQFMGKTESTGSQSVTPTLRLLGHRVVNASKGWKKAPFEDMSLNP